jgi:glycosyltransferase involved in cell wall biosynthesis
MRIALVDPASFTPPYDHALASALARRGLDVDLVTSPFVYDDPPAPDGYRREELFIPLSSRLTRRFPRSRLRVPLKGLEYWPSVLRFRRWVASAEPDVVHLQWLPRPSADVRWVRALAAGRRTVVTAHDVVPRREGQMDAWLEILNAVDRVVVHSSRAVERLAALGVPRERLVRIAHPIFDVSAGPLGPPEGKTLLFFGLLRRYKGLDVLIDALPAALARVPDARLVVAGDPFDPVEPLRDQAARLGVEQAIDWRLGYVRDEQIRPLMAEAAVVVLPYRELDSSGVLATALGYGRPAIVSDVGSLGETVAEFGAGKVVPPGDPAALAVACAELLADPAALREAAAGAADAARTLSWEECGRLHEQLYEEVASRHA